MLADLAAGVDLEELDTDQPDHGNGEEAWLRVDDDVDGWIDKRDDLSDEEREDLRESVLPVKLALAKVTLATYPLFCL